MRGTGSLLWFKIINSALFFSALVQAATGLVIFSGAQFRFAEANASIHRINSLLLISLICTHVYLNWGWVKATMKRRKPVKRELFRKN